ncbi:MAG TPA: NAD(P)-dependent oxidoreductase [Pseudomonadales bacterium]|nr:NAD(P)-dependent oxidoreductase [Pseudomonadales bacterium]
MASVAFIGLGVMGYPMAGHLAAAGHNVVVYNRTLSKAQQWVDQHGGRWATSPAEAATAADIVFSCVGNDDDVRQVLCGDQGALSTMRPGSVLVDHTTASAELARELYQAAARVEVGFLDAPVSGGQAGAENGQLTIMVGGDQTPFDIAEPVMHAYARACRLLGKSGAGQLCKMVNQVCIAGVLQGLAEALNFGSRAGLDMPAVIDVISKGAAQSWQMDNRAATMLRGEYAFGFAVDWMRKDLAIVLAEAEKCGADMTVTRLVDSYYREVQALGGQRWDTSSLMARLAHHGEKG